MTSSAVKSAGGYDPTSRLMADLTPAQLQASLKRLEKEAFQLHSKRRDLEQDLSEYKVVLEAFASVPTDRRCYRMVGGVLVERTVAEVKPTLISQKAKIEEAVESLTKEFEKVAQEKEFVTERLRRQLESTAASQKK